MELKEFQGLALRTESQIDGIRLNRSNLITLLKVVVEVTEILDGIKKAAFYNKTSKLEGDLTARLAAIAKLIAVLDWQNSGRGPVGAIMDPDETIPNVDPRVFHGVLGIITESGELASALLKSVEDPAHVIDAVNIQEEMSDIAWYKAILHDTLGLDWNQGLENVINKLRVRYPDKYSDDAAANRDLFAERVELERGVNVADMNADEMNTVHDFNRESASQAGRFFGDLPKEQDILNKYNNVIAVINPEHANHERRIFYVDIPDGTTSEELEVIFSEVRNRVRYVDSLPKKTEKKGRKK